MTDARLMKIEDYKTLVKDMLGYVHKVCIENNIHYFVAYGTLIGAVRHDGYIPWDDDIDIWMLGEDYERFVDVFSQSTQNYYILSADNSPNYYNLMSRICSKAGTLKLKGVTNIDNLGPFIDIFPIYKAPEEYEERMKFYEEIKNANFDVRYSIPFKYYRTQTLKGQVSSVLQIIKRIKKRYFIGTKELKRIRRELVTKYENTDSDCYYAVFDLARISDKRIFSRKEIDEVEAHRFEDIEVLIPKAYDSILTRIYGDYMKLPPIEERVAHHHFIPYWK